MRPFRFLATAGGYPGFAELTSVARKAEAIGCSTFPILYFSARLIRAGAWNAYLPVLLPGRLRIRPQAHRASR
jgi:hypothetical protein